MEWEQNPNEPWWLDGLEKRSLQELPSFVLMLLSHALMSDRDSGERLSHEYLEAMTDLDDRDAPNDEVKEVLDGIDPRKTVELSDEEMAILDSVITILNVLAADSRRRENWMRRQQMGVVADELRKQAREELEREYDKMVREASPAMFSEIYKMLNGENGK